MNDAIIREIKKVEKKIPEWKKNPNQYCSMFLQSFFDLEGHIDGIDKQKLIKRYESICPRGYTEHDKNNLRDMKKLEPKFNARPNKNHPKVFEEKNNKIYLWQPVEDYVKSVWLDDEIVLKEVKQKKCTWTHVVIEIAKIMGEVNFKDPNYENTLNKVIDDLGYEPKRERLVENSQVSFSDNSSYIYGLDIFEREKGQGIYRLKDEYIDKPTEQIIEIAKAKKHNIIIEELAEDSKYQAKIDNLQKNKKGKEFKKPAPKDKPEYSAPQDNSNRKIPKRDPKVAVYAKQEAQYKCEIDESDITFNGEDGNQYVESHHIVPMAMQEEIEEKFNVNLDQYQNIATLCPNCHRAIHFAKIEKKEELAEILIDNKIEGLQEIGFKDCDKKDLIKMAIGKYKF